MLGFPKSQTRRKADPETVSRLFSAVMDLTRSPVFYTRFQVPDNTDGRYDLMCVMLSLFLFRVQQADPETAQALFDWAFRNTELGLREAGVGDLGVPKHMKRMLQAFYGRAASYYEALEQGQSEGLAVMLSRNLYNQQNTLHPQANAMAEWVRIAWQFLSQLDAKEFMDHPETMLELVPPANED